MSKTFEISSKIPNWRKLTGPIQVRIANEFPELLEILGIQLLTFVALDYRTKARGGTGEDGVKWDELAQSTTDRKRKRGRGGSSAVEIGVDSGLQQASGYPGATDNIFDMGTTWIRVGYGRSYSQFFDEKRPIIPEDSQVPEGWLDSLDSMASEWASNILQQGFDDGI